MSRWTNMDSPAKLPQPQHDPTEFTEQALSSSISNASVVIDIEEDYDDTMMTPGFDQVGGEESEDALSQPLDKSEAEVADNDDDGIPITQDQDSQEINMETDDGEVHLDQDDEDFLKSVEIEEAKQAKLCRMKQHEQQQLSIFNSFKRYSNSERMFPDVRLSDFHTVAFNLLRNFKPGDPLLPYPLIYVNKWDGAHVAMPCNPRNTIRRKVSITNADTGNPTEENSDETEQQSAATTIEIRLWDRIEQSLTDRVFHCYQDIDSAMRFFYNKPSTLNVLQYAIETLMGQIERDNFLQKVVPSIANLCLRLPKLVTTPIPLLKRFRNYSITFSQEQIASLLANAFFSTFPRFDSEASYSYPTINFNELFSCDSDDSRFISRANKVRCILHYFERVTENEPKGAVTFTRKSVRTDKTPGWSESSKKLSKVAVLCNGTIEDTGRGLMQVDFANRFVGGGVLRGGAVQEEILFVIYPELLISRLFTENLAPTEALIITGCERFSKYSGYASGFTYDGDFLDSTPWDSKARKCTQIIAIDALYIKNPVTQFHPKKLARELNKAFVGFSSPSPTPSSVAIASGNWGCGAFNGNPELKAILQLLAASQAGRDLAYFTFGNMDLQDTLIKMFSIIQGKTVKCVWSLLKQYYSLFCASGKPTCSLSVFLANLRPPPDQDDEEPGAGRTEIKAIPPRSFYPSDDNPSTSPATNANSGKDHSNSAPGSSNSTPRHNSETTKKSDDWLSSLNNLKSKFGSNCKKIKTDPFSLAADSSKDSKNLSEEQIADILTNDEDSMDVVDISDDNCDSEKDSNIKSKKPTEEDQEQTIDSTSKKPRTKQKDVNSPTRTGTPGLSKKPSSSMRQMTLTDFYKN